MFTLRQSLGALAAIAAAPLASAVPITTFSRIGVSSNGMDILSLQVNAAMSPGHLTENTTMSFVVDTHSSKVTCTGSWAPEGPFPEGAYVNCLCKQHSRLELQGEHLQGMNDFTLQMEYTYTDDSVGPYPYNKVTEFSHANITSTNVACSSKAQSCQEPKNSTITAIVYAEIA
ncbi:hypothetical protein KCU92_g7407, partial [Aureobasidium melanogenum]